MGGGGGGGGKASRFHLAEPILYYNCSHACTYSFETLVSWYKIWREDVLV